MVECTHWTPFLPLFSGSLNSIVVKMDNANYAEVWVTESSRLRNISDAKAIMAGDPVRMADIVAKVF